MARVVALVLAIAIVAGGIAVIGRVLWAILAWLFGVFVGFLRELGIIKTRRCSWCASPMPPMRFRCQVCQLPDARQERNLIGAIKTLERLHRRGQLADDQYAALTKLVGDELALAIGTAVQPLPGWLVRILEQGEKLTPRVVSEAPVLDEVTEAVSPVEPAAALEPIEAATVAEAPGALLSPVPFAEAAAAALAAPATASPAAVMVAPDAKRIRPPKRAWKTLLQTFMEEKNIRWGELVGGMLIVGCSVGLVVSLWATLQQAIPYFPALLFMGLTAGIHGAGMYTLRHWKLESTSRGLLLVAALLTPLNFMTLVILSQQRPADDPFFWIGSGLGLVLFGGVAWQAGRVLTAAQWWTFWLGVLGSSFGQLVVSRGAGPELSDRQLWLLAAVPLAAYLAAFAGLLSGIWRRLTLDADDARKLFVVLGTGSFAFLLAEGLLVHLSLGELAFGAERLLALRVILGRLAPLVNLAAVPAIVLGLLLHRRVVDRALAAERTMGTTLAMLGVGVLVLAVLLAWPAPLLLLAVAAVNFLLLTTIGGVCGLALLHVPAMACAALAVLIGVHHAELLAGGIALGDSEPLVRALLAGKSGLVLVLLAGVCVIAGALLRRFGREDHAAAYVWNAAGLAGVATAVAFYAGFWSLTDVEMTTPVFAAVAVAAFIANLRLLRPGLAHLASGLALVSILHALHWNTFTIDWLARTGLLPDRPVMATFAIHATIATLIGAIFGALALRNPAALTLSWRDTTGLPFAIAGGTTAALALPWILLDLPHDSAGAAAGLAFWIAALWLASALVHQWHGLFAAFQVLTSVSAVLGVTALGQRQDWWLGIERSSADPRFLQMQGAGLILSGLALVGLRLAGSFWGHARSLLGQSLRVDYVLIGIAIAGSIGLAVAGCVPGILGELGSGSIEPVFGPRIPHAAAFGWSAWGLLGLSVVALAILTLEVHCTAALAGIVLVGATVPFFIAGPFEERLTTASVLRWGMSFYGLAAAGAVAWGRYLPAEAFWRLRERIGGRIAGTAVDRPSPDRLLHALRGTTLLVSAAPLVVLTLVSTAHLDRQALGALPPAKTIFAAIGPVASYAIPLFLVTVQLAILALPDRAAGFVFTGGLVANLATTVAVLASSRIGYRPGLLALWQWNVIASAGYAVVWQLARRWLALRGPLGTRLLAVQTALGPMGTALLAMAAVVAILVSPGGLSTRTAEIGRPLAYVGLLMSGAGLVQFLWRRLAEHSHWLAAAFGLCGAAFLAVATGPKSQPSDWLCYHLLSATWLGVGWFLAAGAWLLRSTDLLRWEAASRRWSRSSATVAALVVLLILRGVVSDPVEWWSSIATVAVTALIATIGVREKSQGHAYASTALLLLAVTLVWAGPLRGHFDDNVIQASIDWLMTLAAAAAVAGTWWLAVELWHQRRRNAVFDPQATLPPVHRPVIRSTLIVSSIVTGYALAAHMAPAWSDPTGTTAESVANLCGWGMLLAMGALVTANAWERTARDPLAALYVWGLVATGMILDSCSLAGRWATLATGIAAAAYLVTTAAVWSQRRRLADLARRCGVPNPSDLCDRAAAWLDSVSLLLALAVGAVALWTVLTFPELSSRLLAAGVVLTVAPGLALLADTPARARMQVVTLVAAAVAAVDFGWAIMPVVPDAHFWLHRSIRLMVVLSAVGFVYGVVLVRWLAEKSDWLTALRRAGAVVGAAAVISLMATLAMEAVWYRPAPDRLGAPVTGPQIAVVALALVGLIATCISLALLPGRDPLGLSEHGRMLYVYAAELVAALLFVHIYLTMPWLFSGYLRPYWPLIVMAIAYVGVGLAELFERLGLLVLAEPLKRSGAFLPILPVLGFWIYASQTDYSTLLLSVGLLYGVLAATQQSFGFALLAALAGNGGLWAMFHERGQAFYEHPQLWLIPPALSVLAAAQVNRDRLAAGQLAAIRYLAVVTIYASSTADMFLTGVGESLWLPMILAALSVAGIFCGILLRVRAFLYLGAAFLFLSILSMVYHAHRHIDHVWPWWAFGITLGMGILALFGVFEKKRNEVVALVENLRQWDR